MTQTLPFITTRRHHSIKYLKDIRDGIDKRFVFCEGLKPAHELTKSSWKIIEYFATKALHRSEKGSALLRLPQFSGVTGTLLSEDVMSFVSDLTAPPGLIVIAERPSVTFPTFMKEELAHNHTPLFVVLGGLQLPNNSGAVMRVAEAAGVNAVFHCHGGIDPLGPKSLRASAGSVFRIPLFTGYSFGDWIKKLIEKNIACVAADPHGDTSYMDWDWTKGTALLLGSEGQGIKKLIKNVRNHIHTVRVPMKKPVQSLNVSVTAGILLYEAQRQRAKK